MKQIITDILLNGRIKTWSEYAEEYNIKEGFPKHVRAKAANDIWRNYLKKQKRNKSNKIPSFKREGMYLVLGCVHAPFVNKLFWNAMLKLAKERKNDISGLVLNGDFLDLHSLSAYDKGQVAIKGINLGTEYEGGRKYLNSILDVLNSDIYKGWIRGNHEHRYYKYMKNVDNSKLGGALQSPENALKLKEKGFDIYLDWVNDEIQLGDLTTIHGEFCNVHCTKKYIDVFKKNFLFNHTHRSSMFREGEHVAYNGGSMGDFNSPIFNYATKAMKKTWSNSFSVATLYKGKAFVEQPVWNENHFVYGGKIYT